MLRWLDGGILRHIPTILATKFVQRPHPILSDQSAEEDARWGSGGQRQGVALLLLRRPLWRFGMRPILLFLVPSRRRMAIQVINVIYGVVVAASER